MNVGVTAPSSMTSSPSSSSNVSSLSSESGSASTSTTSYSSSSASEGTATAAMPRVPMVRRPLPPKVKRSVAGGDGWLVVKALSAKYSLAEVRKLTGSGEASPVMQLQVPPAVTK